MTPDHLDSLAFTLTRYQAIVPDLLFPIDRPAEIPTWRTAARTRLAQLLALPSIPIPPRDERWGNPHPRPGYTRSPVTFTTQPDLDAFGHLLIPDGLKGPAPAILCLPGHGQGADEIVGINPDGSTRDHLDGYQHDFAVQCAQRGYVTLALEMLGFGHRRDPAARRRGPESSSCQPAAGAALMLGQNMAGWRTWDAQRALDLLAARPEVDPARIGLIGISGGGTVALYTAALDQRVAATLLSGSFCTFRDSVFSISHCIDNYVPGILQSFEMPDLAGLIAPRPLFVESGDADDIFPRPGVEAALRRAEAIYRACQAPDNLAHAFFNAGHQFDGAAAFPRLAQWLKHQSP